MKTLMLITMVLGFGFAGCATSIGTPPEETEEVECEEGEVLNEETEECETLVKTREGEECRSEIECGGNGLWCIITDDPYVGVCGYPSV